MQTITIFGRAGCGYCTRARQLAESRGLDYRYIDIHEAGISKSDLEKTIGKPVLTVPQIFHGQQHIGGYTEFAEFMRPAAES